MDEITHESTGGGVGFSWSPCDRCNSGPAGYRFEWFAWDNETHESVSMGEVCADCVLDIGG